LHLPKNSSPKYEYLPAEAHDSLSGLQTTHVVYNSIFSTTHSAPRVLYRPGLHAHLMYRLCVSKPIYHCWNKSVSCKQKLMWLHGSLISLPF